MVVLSEVVNPTRGPVDPLTVALFLKYSSHA